jgi:hypothetical protein
VAWWQTGATRLVGHVAALNGVGIEILDADGSEILMDYLCIKIKCKFLCFFQQIGLEISPISQNFQSHLGAMNKTAVLRPYEIIYE